MTCIRSIALGLVLSATTAVTPVLASTVMISARASTVCRIDFTGTAPAALPSGETGLGRMTELCNSADGYRLVLRHPRGLTDASLIVDGRRIPITAGADETIIVDSDLPGFRERAIAIALADGVDSSSLSFEARPKGMIF